MVGGLSAQSHSPGQLCNDMSNTGAVTRLGAVLCGSPLTYLTCGFDAGNLIVEPVCDQV